MIDQKFHVGDVAVYINEHGYYGKNYFKVRVLNAFQEEDDKLMEEIIRLKAKLYDLMVK